MLLQERGVTNVRTIQDAFVPVIKLEFEGIEVTIFRPSLKMFNTDTSVHFLSFTSCVLSTI